MARKTHRGSAPEKILAALDADPALIEHYDPFEIEVLPIADIQVRLAELGLPPSMPSDLQKAIVDSAPSPATTLLSLLDDQDDQDIKSMPLAEVTTHLQERGINYRAGLAEINKIVQQQTLSSVDGDEAVQRPIIGRQVISMNSAHLTKLIRQHWTRCTRVLVPIAPLAVGIAATFVFLIAGQVLQDHNTIAAQDDKIHKLMGQVAQLRDSTRRQIYLTSEQLGTFRKWDARVFQPAAEATESEATELAAKKVEGPKVKRRPIQAAAAEPVPEVATPPAMAWPVPEVATPPAMAYAPATLLDAEAIAQFCSPAAAFKPRLD